MCVFNRCSNTISELSIKKNRLITNKDINRGGSKVIFIANTFNKYQQESINFREMPIELREMKRF